MDEKAKRSFLPRPIHELLADDDNNIPIILGCTTHEFIMFIRGIRDCAIEK